MSLNCLPFTKNKVKYTPFKTDYEGIAKVLAQFTELYKVCDNKELLDKSLEQFFQSLNSLSFKELKDIHDKFYNKHKL